jgi:hypothetical protein
VAVPRRGADLEDPLEHLEERHVERPAAQVQHGRWTLDALLVLRAYERI